MCMMYVLYTNVYINHEGHIYTQALIIHMSPPNCHGTLINKHNIVIPAECITELPHYRGRNYTVNLSGLAAAYCLQLARHKLCTEFAINFLVNTRMG